MRALVKVSAVLVLFGALAGLSLTLGGAPANADGGPHGGYTATGGASGGLPDQCAGCHRVHQGKSVGKLLKANSPYALCLTCHNGQGSKLDVFDGVKLGATVTPNATIVRSADSATLNLSVAPGAALSVPPGVASDTEFTLAIRNRSTAGPQTVTVVIASDSQNSGTGDFTASTLSAASVEVPAATASAVGIAYLDLVTHTAASAAATDSNLTTVTASVGAESATVIVQTLVGSDAQGTSTVGTSATLNGGGFMFVGGRPVTSRHNADPADESLRPWGFDTNNTGQSTFAGSTPLASALQCTSCHNPHGTANYRLLKEQVNGNTVNVKAWYAGAATKDEGGSGDSFAEKYTQNFYGSAGTGTNAGIGGKPVLGTGSLASLCGACHTAYPSGGADEPNTAGGVTHYRHATEMPYTNWGNPDKPVGSEISDNPEDGPITGFPALRLASLESSVAKPNGTNTVVTCLTCHRVHGTATTMSGYAKMQTFGGLGDNDLTPSQTATSTSTLLYTDNRGMCQACHQWGTPADSTPVP